MLTGIGISIVFGIIAAIILQGIRNIPAEPPHKGVVTRFGERTGKVIKEGWHWFFLYPWWSGVVLIDMTAKNQDFVPGDVRTAEDMAELEVKASLTFKPDPDNLINYLNFGGEKGIKDVMDDVIPEAIRELAANPDKKPNTWEDAVKMKPVFLAEIVATVIGKDLATMPPDELNKLARDLRRGNGSIQLETLGIIISRLNVTDVNPKGELAKAAEQEAVEKRQKKAEEVEIGNVIARIKELMAPSLGYSKEQALEVVQTERKKVIKEIKEHKISVSSETADVLKGLVTSVFKK